MFRVTISTNAENFRESAAKMTTSEAQPPFETNAVKKNANRRKMIPAAAVAEIPVPVGTPEDRSAASTTDLTVSISDHMSIS